MKKNKKTSSEGKKIHVKECTKPLLCNTNYDRENNDSTNALRPRRFKKCNFSQRLYDIVLYARQFLPVMFFSKYYSSKLCFELPQNV